MEIFKDLISVMALAASAFDVARANPLVPAKVNDTALWAGWVAPPCDKVVCCVPQEYGNCAVGLWLSWETEPMYAYIYDFNCKIIGFHDGLSFESITSVSSELPGYVVIAPHGDPPSEFWYLGKHHQNDWKDKGVTKHHNQWYDRKNFEC